MYRRIFSIRNIPYKIYGGLSFYERKEIKDILAYFRMVINHEDEEAFRRSINYPKRGIGDTTVNKVLELASASNLTPWSIITEPEKYNDQFNSGTAKKLRSYAEMINTLSVDSGTLDAFTKARDIAFGSGIMRELREGRSPEEVSRFENLEELLNAIKSFTESATTNGEPDNLEAYMANVALLTDQDTEKAEDRNKVTLMTMHSAKGLEFKHVYIVGMEDTLFPSPLSAGNARELEEERRLFYVAVTRAEKQATLSYALNRYKWGNLERCSPSRFIREIDQRYLNYPQTGGKPFGNNMPYGQKHTTIREVPGSYINNAARLKKLPATGTASAGTGSFSPAGSVSFAAGDKVEHERFGNGIIRSIEGQAPNTTATVEFEREGNKKLLLRFAKLRKRAE
jgi:DNA helicase-2/ATP-dependent DNA helicase PcrA